MPYFFDNIQYRVIFFGGHRYDGVIRDAARPIAERYVLANGLILGCLSR